jgi:hypothetical protein
MNFPLKNPYKWGLTALSIRRTFAFSFKKRVTTQVLQNKGNSQRENA